MDVSSVTGTHNPSFITKGAANIMGKNEFLNLLVTQLRYQNPLDPMSNTEFVAQLAQFSSLEQIQNLNASFADQSALILSLNNSMATALIGREVVVASSEFCLEADARPRIGFTIGTAAQSATVEIRDAGGGLVRSIQMGAVSSGRHQLEWDGLDNQGQRAPEGTYSIHIEAGDANGVTVSAYPMVIGRVASVEYEAGMAYFMVCGVRTPIAALLEVLGFAQAQAQGQDGSAAPSTGGQATDPEPGQSPDPEPPGDGKQVLVDLE
ncbi:MAG: hypothetical protein KAY24_10045 [Candidatus Eisenbacteria sp.]|nr:hypothetical protein [Candidatus Eisenbacteria bacterium]